MAKEMCEDCGKVFECGKYAFYCPDCRKERQRKSAKERNLNKIGNDAYSAKVRARND